MIPIDSPADFEAMLRAECAVVFIIFGRSGDAIMSQRIFEQWERELAIAGKGDFISYQLSPDDQPYTWKWVNEIIGHSVEGEHRYGAVAWLRNGVLVSFEQNAARAGIKGLERVTNNCFVLGLDAKAQTAMVPFDLELLKILCCPETHQELQLAASPILEKLNREIAVGRLQNRAGQTVREKVDGGLVRADGRYLYPMRENIPVLLVDEAILLGG